MRTNFRRRPDPDDEQWQRIEASVAKLEAQLVDAQQRIYTADDSTRAMSTRLDAALDRARLATTARNQALAINAQLTDRVRELGHEVAALRVLLERAQAPRPAVQYCCPECHDPMPFGMAHYCGKTSTYTEGTAAA